MTVWAVGLCEDIMRTFVVLGAGWKGIVAEILEGRLDVGFG